MALAVIIVSYLIGAIPTGLIVVRLLTGEDIRRHGSGNIRTVNVLGVSCTGTASLGSLLALVSVPLSLRLLRQPDAYLYFGIIAALFAVYRHRANIQRLVTGTELHITDREPIKK